jgi:hypothetical protein
MIENVQKMATKQIPGMKNVSYEEHLRKLELPTLSYRWLRGDMIEVYKIIQGHYDPEASTIIKLMNDTEQIFSTRTNSKKVVYNITRLLYFLYFSVRHTASRYISFIVCVVQFFVFPMFIQSVFERVNIFWQFIPVSCYSNAEGVLSDVSVCSIIYHFLAIGSCTKYLLCVIH